MVLTVVYGLALLPQSDCFISWRNKKRMRVLEAAARTGRVCIPAPAGFQSRFPRQLDWQALTFLTSAFPPSLAMTSYFSFATSPGPLWMSLHIALLTL